MAGETIKEFFVGLGWQNNDAQYAKFVSTLEGATVRAKLLGDVMEDVARKVYESVSQAAESFEHLYYQSIRTGQSAASIKEFAYAVSQLGGTAAGAVGSLEAMGEKLRANPGYITYLHALGFGLDKVTGQFEYQKDLAEKAAKMPIFTAKQYAAGVGLDENTLLAMRQVEQFRARIDEARKSMAAAGLDPDKAAADATDFEQKQRKLFNDIGNDYDKLVTTMAKSLTPGLVALDDFLKTQQPGIVKGIDGIGNSLGKVVDEIKYLLKLEEDSKNWEIIKELNYISGEDKNTGNVQTGANRSNLQVVGDAIKWFFGPGAPSGRTPHSSSANAFDQPTRGLSIGGKEISLERADDGGINGTALGGATRGIEVNGTKVGPGNPLPVSIDNFGFGSNGGDVSSGDSPSGTGLLGAVGNAVKRMFGLGSGAPDSYGAGSSHVPKAEGLARAGHLVDHLMKTYGLDRTQAIGAAGVMGYESGDFTTMQEKGQPAGRGGWGYAQWTGPRRRNFMNWFKQSGLKDPSSVEANEGFLDYELTHGYGRAINAIKGTHDVQSAALSWEHVFEGMDGTAGIPAFGAHVARAVAYSKLPQLQAGYFAASPGGDSIVHAGVHGSHNNITNTFHIDGTQDPEITARMIGSHIHRENQDLVRNMIGATQ